MCKYAVFLFTLILVVVYLPIRCYVYSRKFTVTVNTQDDDTNDE